MNDFLLTHALKHVWCDPEQDFQHIFRPQRISRPIGVVGTCDVLWRTLLLPTPKDQYHIYQIGQISPSVLGLVATMGQWTKLSDVMNQKLVYIQIYTGEGKLFPLAESYLMVTKDRALVLAVKEQPTIAPLRNTPLYFRFYSNTFLASKRSYGSTNTVTSRFYRHDTDVNGLTFQHLYTQHQSKPGFCALTLNGEYIQNFIPMQLTVGDILEFVYDSTVKKVVDFSVRDLDTFESTKDAKTKYLLHYAGSQATPAGEDAVVETIDYRDDCDVYLFKKSADQSNFKGVYFHKNQDDAFRQVTHRDYALSVPYVAAYQTSQPTWSDIDDLTVRVVIRNAGYDRPLVNEAHRIKELYKLDEQHLVNAFLGIESNVAVWRAPSLEASDYVGLMGDARWEVNQSEVESAYGYNAIASLIGQSPQLLNGNTWVDLPPALWSKATMYEYDANGLLLGWYPHELGAQYSPVYPGCTLIEGCVGQASYYLPQVMDQQDVPLAENISYRFYTAEMLNGQVNHATWKDVTDDGISYGIVNGTCHWLVDMSAYMTCVKSDQSILTYEFILDAEAAGGLRFSVNAGSSYPSSNTIEPLYIPVGSLELWVNGYALIENIDYYVTWPEVAIVNKEYLIEGSKQKITVRGSGFCHADLSRRDPDEVNFLRYGVLSHNDVFNIRDDKVIRIVARGKVFDRSQVVFAEDEINATLPAIPNGSPYMVRDVIVPTRNFTEQDTYTLLATSQPVDQVVSNYLTLKHPDTYPPTPDIIEDKYSIYSPFADAIVHDMIDGKLSMDDFKGQYSDKDIKDRLAGYYTTFLDYDPVNRGVDTTHVAIHPHREMTVINLSIYQYNFLSRAVHLYLDDKVDLSKFLAIVWY